MSESLASKESFLGNPIDYLMDKTWLGIRKLLGPVFSAPFKLAGNTIASISRGTKNAALAVLLNAKVFPATGRA